MGTSSIVLVAARKASRSAAKPWRITCPAILIRKVADTANFCPSPRCEVVYFDAFERVVLTADLPQPVYPKDPAAPLCALFRPDPRGHRSGRARGGGNAHEGHFGKGEIGRGPLQGDGRQRTVVRRVCSEVLHAVSRRKGIGLRHGPQEGDSPGGLPPASGNCRRNRRLCAAKWQKNDISVNMTASGTKSGATERVRVRKRPWRRQKEAAHAAALQFAFLADFLRRLFARRRRKRPWRAAAARTCSWSSIPTTPPPCRSPTPTPPCATSPPTTSSSSRRRPATTTPSTRPISQTDVTNTYLTPISAAITARGLTNQINYIGTIGQATNYTTAVRLQFAQLRLDPAHAVDQRLRVDAQRVRVSEFGALRQDPRHDSDRQQLGHLSFRFLQRYLPLRLQSDDYHQYYMSGTIGYTGTRRLQHDARLQRAIGQHGRPGHLQPARRRRRRRHASGRRRLLRGQQRHPLHDARRGVVGNRIATGDAEPCLHRHAEPFLHV